MDRLSVRSESTRIKVLKFSILGRFGLDDFWDRLWFDPSRVLVGPRAKTESPERSGLGPFVG